MRIVVLDGYTLNPGDLSWEPLAALGSCVVHDRTPPGLIVARTRDAELVVTNKTALDGATIRQLPRLRYIGVSATGFNIVDVAAARERGIVVTNVPAYGTAAVAQLTFALLLELTHRVGDHSAAVRAGRWSASPDWCFWDHPLLELDGRALGIVGYGRIGQAVGRLGRALGMRVLAHARTPQVAADVEFVELDDLFRRSDVVTLHCPLTPATAGLVDARRLALMKPTALLLNASRGPLVVEADLADALNAGRLAGAGLDVLGAEPPRPDNPLLAARNCVITPHLGWATQAARARLLAVVVDNVRAFLAGQPRNLVQG